MRPQKAAHRSGGNTVVGRVRVANGELRLEANSIERASVLRERIEGACGDLVRHRAREHSDPVASFADSHQAVADVPEIPDAEANKLALDFKRRHYAAWIDQPLPPLRGDTPRQAVRTKAGRDQVALLLKHCENLEARMPVGERFDFSSVSRELGV